ncbi:MAG: MarR family transcriptional regulator [Pseudomonadota bacterium]
MVYTGDFPATLQLLAYFKMMTDDILDDVTSGNKPMTSNQIELIAILGRRMTMKEVAEAMRMHPSNLTGLVNACSDAGWIERVPSKTDKRTKYLVLTPSGAKKRQLLLGDLADAMFRVSGITDEVAAQMLSLIKIPEAA